MSHLAPARSVAVPVAVMLLAAMPAAAPAQARLQVTPFFASYYPLANIAERNDVPLATIVGNPPGDIRGRQVAGAAFGARVSYPLTGVIRVEGEGVYAFSDGRISYVPGGSGSGLEQRGDAHVYMFTGRAVFRPRRQNFFGLAGGGIVGRGGDFYSASEQSVRAAAVLGLGLHSSVTQAFGVDIVAEVFLYNTRFTSVNFPTPVSKFQQDVLVTVGIPLPGR